MKKIFQKTFFTRPFFLSNGCLASRNGVLTVPNAKRYEVLIIDAVIICLVLFCSITLTDTNNSCFGQESQTRNGFSAAHASVSKLDWLLGDWTYDTTELRLECSIRWSPFGNYIVSHDTALAPDGSIVYRQVRVIGFNPISELLQAWIFRSDGGFGSALFQQFGDSWIVPTRIILADGRVTTATNIYTPIKSGGYIWKSISRTLNNVELPPLGPVAAQPTTLKPQKDPFLL